MNFNLLNIYRKSITAKEIILSSILYFLHLIYGLIETKGLNENPALAINTIKE